MLQGVSTLTTQSSSNTIVSSSATVPSSANPRIGIVPVVKRLAAIASRLFTSIFIKSRRSSACICNALSCGVNVLTTGISPIIRFDMSSSPIVLRAPISGGRQSLTVDFSLDTPNARAPFTSIGASLRFFFTISTLNTSCNVLSLSLKNISLRNVVGVWTCSTTLSKSIVSVNAKGFTLSRSFQTRKPNALRTKGLPKRL